MALRAANQEDSVTFAYICCLHVLKQNVGVGWGSAIQGSGICLVYGRIAVVVLVVEAVDREWVLHLGHGEVGELPVFLTTATQSYLVGCFIYILTSLHADARCSTVHGDLIKPYMLDVLGVATDRSTMSCTELALPYMDILCIVVANDIVIAVADVTVVDINVWTPDRDSIGVMRCLSLASFR